MLITTTQTQMLIHLVLHDLRLGAAVVTVAQIYGNYSPSLKLVSLSQGNVDEITKGKTGKHMNIPKAAERKKKTFGIFVDFLNFSCVVLFTYGAICESLTSKCVVIPSNYCKLHYQAFHDSQTNRSSEFTNLKRDLWHGNPECRKKKYIT